MRKTRQILGFTAAALFGTVAKLDAQLVDFHGSVAGCFTWTASVANGAQPNCTEPTGGLALPGGGGLGSGSSVTDLTGGAGGTLVYNNDSFWGTALGVGDGNAAGISNPAQNGSFGLVSALGHFNAADFTNLTLKLKFYFDPDLNLINSGSQHTPTANGPFLGATLTGNIFTGIGGNTTVTFAAPAFFSFTNGGHIATCKQVPDICVLGNIFGSAKIVGSVLQLNGSEAAPSQNITGAISITSLSPEPGSIALFATGLVGMIPVVRYRRRKQA